MRDDTTPAFEPVEVDERGRYDFEQAMFERDAEQTVRELIERFGLSGINSALNKLGYTASTIQGKTIM